MELVNKLKKKSPYILTGLIIILFMLNVVQYCVNRSNTTFLSYIDGTYGLENDDRGNYLSFTIESCEFYLWSNGELKDSGGYNEICEGTYVLSGEDEKYYVYKKTDAHLVLIYDKYDIAYGYKRISKTAYVF